MLFSDRFKILRSKTELPDNMWYNFLFECMDKAQGEKEEDAQLSDFFNTVKRTLETNHYFIDPA